MQRRLRSWRWRWRWLAFAAAAALFLAGLTASTSDAWFVRPVTTTARTTTARTTTARTTTSVTTAPTTTVVTPPPHPPPPGGYALHTNIVSTSFWVGEIFNASIADGSQVCSTYDSDWALHWSGGINVGTDPSTDCKGAPIGGCDGVPSGTAVTFKCATERRTAANGFFPTSPLVRPAENPFYLDLPFDDLNDKTAFAERCSVIPWVGQTGWPASKCASHAFSYMKNRWVAILGPSKIWCYGQIEDAGPSSGSAYHDQTYVFGALDARPLNKKFSGDKSQGAGMDVSPALNGCLGFKALDGDDDHVEWQFTDSPPPGPWLEAITSSGVTN